MKKILFTAILLIFVCGCSLDLMTEDNPLGFKDPNQATAFFNAGRQAAQTGQVVGTATGNPALIGGSVLAGAIITALGASYLKGKKNGK